jgi:glycosyltransferase involved in cell wall biosynthesis
MAGLPKSIAIVYDRVNKWGGAERVLLALHDLFPQAPLYTSVYHPQKATWAKVFPQVIPSFLQQIPLAQSFHEIIPFLTPIAFENFNFNQYEAVISVTSADAKGIVTSPHTFHLCYCLTPTRYLWSHFQDYTKNLNHLEKIISQPVFNYLKKWDTIASKRPDVYVAISNTVSDRIKTYYHQDAQVVYPPVDVDVFSQPTTTNSKLPTGNFFLWVGRFVPYKHPEIVIEAFNQLKLPLVVVGSGKINWGIGSFEKKLKALAGPNITFLGHVSQPDLIYLHQACQALIYFHEEDFGITPVEGMAAGRPVIAYNRGGATETVINTQTGILVDDFSVSALTNAVKLMSKLKFDSKIITTHAQKFSRKRFIQKFAKVFSTEWDSYQSRFNL